MLTPEENRVLTRVGPGTPMGRLLRHYWFPVATTGELARGTARRVRLLGEDLVLFRTGDGTPGLFDEACPHRGASLAEGELDADGLRCPYHGWRFGADGACREMPVEDDPSLARRVSARAHHVRELGGLVFAHIGTPAADTPPVLPRYEPFVRDDLLRDVGRARLPCNWLQIMENSVDPTHVEWLHGRHLVSVRVARGLSTPRHHRRRHERIGFELFEHGILKRRIVEGGSEDDDDWAVGHPLVFPVMLQVGAGLQQRFQIRVPEDDTTTRHWWYSTYAAPEGAPAPRQDLDDVPAYEVPWRDERGEFLTDFVDGFLAESLELNHVRHSPLRAEILALLQGRPTCTS